MVLVGLTFDDGFVEQLQIARYLAKRGIRATFFVITGLREYMGHELMGPARWRELAWLGHEVGSHTVTHIDMVKSSEDLIARELVESKKKIEDAIGNEVVSFAYPYGPHSEKAAKLARSIYRVVRTTYIGPASRYQLFDEHGCVIAFNLRLLNMHELPRLVRNFDRFILYTHSPSVFKLSIIVNALRVLNARFMTLSEMIQ
ncbi:polysaccharide deacetylase [Thermogladius calderae 1633]|uniref:Polysaccharide deacetylase n=1 Tax=Thermogladius calderae (strain DSM 22663 / VKM B-2946 / 1633) TaxID=1184251 RepID=I3TCX2_THEC1|nr:polysaccharide deacetylase family protein [Thermogladius calderae]AFK50610.1 polysaccharide deacetylase [Thermogladius calderae 1633]